MRAIASPRARCPLTPRSRRQTVAAHTLRQPGRCPPSPACGTSCAMPAARCARPGSASPAHCRRRPAGWRSRPTSTAASRRWRSRSAPTASPTTSSATAPTGRASRPWSLELLPLLIEPADWAAIEAGVIQRAELLQPMLADVYGPQRLLHEGAAAAGAGVAPPAATCGRCTACSRRPGCTCSSPPSTSRAGRDGRWWVVAQRTQAPSGLGYVLQNRLVISRLFPEAFRDLRVQRIAVELPAPARHPGAGGAARSPAAPRRASCC